MAKLAGVPKVVTKRANEILKKDVGINYSNLTNREKAQIVNALKGLFPLKSLLNIIYLKTII